MRLFVGKGVQEICMRQAGSKETHIDSCPPLLFLIRYIPFGFHLLGRSTRLCTRHCRIWHSRMRHWGYSDTLPARAKPPCTVRLSQVDDRLGS